MSDEAMTPEKIEAALYVSPFHEFLGLRVRSYDADAHKLVIELPMRREIERLDGSGQFHGGPIASLIDTTGDLLVGLAVSSAVPTLNFRVDYLRPITNSSAIATATMRRLGRTMAVVDIDVSNNEHELCAVGRGCFATKRG